MYKIVSSRGGGRTTTLCEYAINNEKNIVTPTFSSAKYIFGIVHNHLKEKGFKILDESKEQYGFNIAWSDKDILAGEDGKVRYMMIISVSNANNMSAGDCVVDDADEVLRMLVCEHLKQNVVGLTMSME